MPVGAPSAAEVQAICDAFNYFDADRNGVLTWLEELEAAEPDGRRSDAYILHRAAATEIFDRILTVE